VLIATLGLLALSSFEPSAPLPGIVRELPATLASGRRVLELTSREPAIADPPEPLPAPPPGAPVELCEATARYPGAERGALAPVSLRLEPGARVAIVGPSGSGKSTIVRLLLRFLDPEDGRVTIGGHDVSDLRQEDVRTRFALAGQDAHVFHSTIRENLRIARPGVSDDELWEALGRARLADRVRSLPGGLGTIVGGDARLLSGGERQRLLVARALLSAAPVLVLDEPTAHLDEPTARALMSDVLDAAGDRALLLITHRSEGLDAMDEIIELAV